MKIVQCKNGHYYDEDKQAICPFCMTEKCGLVKKEGKSDNNHTVLSEEDKTVLLENEKTISVDEKKTVLLEERNKEDNSLSTDLPDQGNTMCSESEEIYSREADKRCLNCMEEYDAKTYEVCPKCGFVRETYPVIAYHLRPGMGLAGRYVIGTVLGYGGFGITYKAWDCKLHAAVAIKEYYPSGIVNRFPGKKDVILYTGKKKEEFQKGLTRFLEEARITAKFNNHPNIVHVFDYFEENGTAYMVMELLNGCNLQTYMEQSGGKIPWEEAQSVFHFVVEAVKEIHKSGMIHRDLSPDNIFICKDGSVKLMDLGAARFSNEEEEVERTVILKMGLAPPEQYYKKGKQGPWTDVYALAATMYWSITGCEPDESTDRTREDTLKAPSQLADGIPEYVDHALMKGMALIPELRFKNIDQFEKAFLNQQKVNELKKEVEKRKKIRRIGVGLICLLLSAAFGWGWNTYTQAKTNALLKESEITVWLSIPEGQSEEEINSRWMDMTEEFREEYPYVHITTSLIPAGEYYENLNRELAQGTGIPTMFESANVLETNREKLADVQDTLTLLDLNDFYFLNNYQEYYLDGKQIPLGFHAAVVYSNTLLETEKLSDNNSIQDFLEQKSAICVNDTMSFARVQSEMPGIYAVQAIPGDTMAAFDQIWSINQTSEEIEKLAAARLLSYFLGEKAQNAMHIINKGSIPLIKSQVDTYLDVNQELSFLKDSLDHIKLIDQEEMEMETEKLYWEIKKGRKLTTYGKSAVEE